VAERQEGPAGLPGDEARIRRLAELGRLVAEVAHELAGPLQAVITRAELLARDPERPDAREAAHRILRAARRCRGSFSASRGPSRRRRSR